MAEEAFVELRYQGIELGTGLCMREFTESGAYVQLPQPMPVGTALVVHAADDVEIPVLVRRIQEQVSGAERPPGMFVDVQALEGAARSWWSGYVSDAANPAIAEPGDAADTDVMTAMTDEDAADVEQTDVRADAPEDVTADEKAHKETESSKASAAEADDDAKSGKKKRRRRKKKS